MTEKPERTPDDLEDAGYAEIAAGMTPDELAERRAMAASRRARRAALSRSEEEQAELMSEIEKGQQLAGHFPNAEALDRAERVLSGETTYEDAKAELRAKYRPTDEDQS